MQHACAYARSVLDRKRRQYRILHGCLRLLIRYILGFVLLGYGFSKLFPLQFTPTMFWRMMTPYGEFTTYEILWRVMGASQLYMIFTSLVETLGPPETALGIFEQGEDVMDESP